MYTGAALERGGPQIKFLSTVVAATLACSLALVLALAVAAAPAAASGGVGTGATAPAKFERAKLRDGKAIAPRSAPRRVKRAIAFANRIRTKPYLWGGGHRSWEIDRGYDCSGAVSYALRGARAISRPMTSGDLMRWGRRGRGKWITVYAHGGHTYAMIAGLRFDTQGGNGPRWHRTRRSASGFRARHVRGL